MLSFHVKFVQRDGQTVRQVDNVKTICSESFDGGIKIFDEKQQLVFSNSTLESF